MLLQRPHHPPGVMAAAGASSSARRWAGNSSSSSSSSSKSSRPRPPPSATAASGGGSGGTANSAASRSRSSTRSRSPAGPPKPAPGAPSTTVTTTTVTSGGAQPRAPRRTRQKSGERAPSRSGNGGNGIGATPQQQPQPRQTSSSPSPSRPGTSSYSPSSMSNTTSPMMMMGLVSNPDIDEAVARAPSASDAAVLRRKGHLKEQDRLIEFMRDMHATHTCEEVMAKVERWVADHRQDPRRSRLRRVVPTVGSFFTPLGLVDAFREYDAVFHLSCRRYIPPNFAELRHVLNIAQVRASAEGLRLVTFDADGTLYADGHHIEQDSAMVEMIVSLMRAGVHVGIVTAAGYPGDASKFEGRIAGLLGAFDRYGLPPELTARFHLMGGECNYLLRVARRPRSASSGGALSSMDGGVSGVGGGAWPNSSTTHQHRLEFVPDEEWQTPEMLAWDPEEVVRLLDAAQAELIRGAARLCLPVSLIRKTRSVGVVPAAPTIYEVLEELALTVQQQLSSKLPFCAFNGGNDVFVDVGNKSLGLDALMRHLGCYPHETLHVGDRFTDSGNDTATRDCCSIVWVANPEETSFFMRLLLRDLAERGRGGGFGGGADGGGVGGVGVGGVGVGTGSQDEDVVGGDGRRGRGRRRPAAAGGGGGSALSSRDGA